MAKIVRATEFAKERSDSPYGGLWIVEIVGKWSLLSGARATHTPPLSTARIRMSAFLGLNDQDVFKMESSVDAGNYIVATSDLCLQDTIIDQEKPLVWNQLPITYSSYRIERLHALHQSCDNCGLMLGPCLFDCLRSEIKSYFRDSSTEAESVLVNLQAVLDSFKVNPASTCVINCPSGCGRSYCSEQCCDEARTKGHSWLCGSYCGKNRKQNRKQD